MIYNAINIIRKTTRIFFQIWHEPHLGLKKFQISFNLAKNDLEKQLF